MWNFTFSHFNVLIPISMHLISIPVGIPWYPGLPYCHAQQHIPTLGGEPSAVKCVKNVTIIQLRFRQESDSKSETTSRDNNGACTVCIRGFCKDILEPHKQGGLGDGSPPQWGTGAEPR